MFFELTQISDHPCCTMQEVVEEFFSKSIGESIFSLSLFPDWFRPTLDKRNCKLDSDFKKVHDQLHKVSITKYIRETVYDTICDSNCVRDICDGNFCISEEVIDWPSSLGRAIESLMERLYGSLDLAYFKRVKGADKPCQEYYKEFISMNKYVCPFCSIKKYTNKLGDRREDFDHYLNKSSYPLSAANMDNLVPTCRECNQDYKGAKDILADGSAFYPYAEIPKVDVKVACLKYPAVDGRYDSGEWAVELTLAKPDPEINSKMTAWDRVYSVKTRLKDEISEFYEEWMEEVAWDVNSELDDDAFIELIRNAKDKAITASGRRMEAGQIIRAAFFEFLISEAEKSFLNSFKRSFNASLA